MRLLSKYSLLLVLSTGSLTYAQAPDPAGSGSASASGSATGEASVSGSVSVSTGLNPTEMSSRAVALQGQTKDDLQHVIHLQAVARKQKDVIKLNCINDRLVQLKAQMNIFDSAVSTLTASLSSTVAADRDSAFNEVTVTADGIKRIRAEADVCAGEDLLRQESSTTVDAPEIPDDPTDWDPAWDPTLDDVEPPGYASPFT
jgi:hypothetical protein